MLKYQAKTVEEMYRAVAFLLTFFAAEKSKASRQAVEGEVESHMKNGTIFKAYFHNTYRLENEKIIEMTSYVVPKM